MTGKRLGLVVVVFALVVAASATGATDRVLSGPIDPSGTVTVKIRFKERHGTTWRVYKFKAEDVPLSCAGGASPTLDISGSVSMRNNAPGRDEFGVGVVADKSHEATYAWSFQGKLVSHNEAEGTVRAHGSEWPLEGGGTDACNSGRLPWTATA